MKTKHKQNIKLGIFGALIGLINGILGAGGGMIAVPFLKKLGFSQKEAHTNAIAIILPITVISAILYIVRGDVAFRDSFVYIPTGLLGAIAGTYLLKKISPKWLKRIFGFLMVYAGFRLLIR